MVTLGQRVKELRQRAGLTQRELKEFLGYKTERSVQRIEADQSVIDHRQVAQLAEFFEVSADYLIGRTDDPTPPERRA